MYIVQIDWGGDAKLDRKFFGKLPDAKARYDAAETAFFRNEAESAALFEVPGVHNLADALARFEAGKATLMRHVPSSWDAGDVESIKLLVRHKMKERR